LLTVPADIEPLNVTVKRSIAAEMLSPSPGNGVTPTILGPAANSILRSRLSTCGVRCRADRSRIKRCRFNRPNRRRKRREDKRKRKVVKFIEKTLLNPPRIMFEPLTYHLSRNPQRIALCIVLEIRPRLRSDLALTA
jgi:hypothetical protein